MNKNVKVYLHISEIVPYFDVAFLLPVSIDIQSVNFRGAVERDGFRN